MEISPLQRAVKASDLQLENLAASQQVGEAEKVAELSRQFEAVLLRHILSAAQKPLITSTTNPDSASRSIYRDLLTNQLADVISRSNAIGLGESLARQLGRQLNADTPSEPEAAAPAGAT